MSGDKEILCGAPRGAISAEAMKEIAKPFLEAKDNRYEAIIALGKERDTYRDLCAELVKALSNHIDQTRPIWESVDVIVKAEKILGEKK